MYNIPTGRFLGYTYENMEKDLGIFARVFQGRLHVGSLGKTADGREIYHMIIGRQDAQEKILIFGGMHGREYMTCQLLMEQTAEFLTLLCKKQQKYKGAAYESLIEGKAVHVLPMTNPDGVSISQFGVKGICRKDLQALIWQIAGEEGGRQPCGIYFNRWKANARGVDLNRNFDALWEEYDNGKAGPSSEKYKGICPESEEESRALAELTRKERFRRTVSYHSSGQVIYWDFGLEGELKEETKAFAQRIARVTGYEQDENWDKQDLAGYKDWALMKMKIPSLTIEVGRTESPLPRTCFREILRENRGVWEETLLSLESREDL